MSLTAGTKFCPYEIQSPLGAGGTGEVYRRYTQLPSIWQFYLRIYKFKLRIVRRQSYADRRAGNWNKFSFCWGLSQF